MNRTGAGLPLLVLMLLFCGTFTTGCWNGAEDPDRFTAISVGYSHNCALRGDGSILCWGRNHWDESPPPEGEFSAITNGGYFSCALRVDGSPVCWGEGTRLGPDKADISPPSNEKLSAISAGYGHVCGIRMNSTAVCWGGNTFGQASAPPAEEFIAITGGDTYSCGLRDDLVPVCWGDHILLSARFYGDLRFTAISGGHNEVCGLEKSGTVFCWQTYSGFPHEPVRNHRLSHLGSHTSSGYGCGLRQDASGLCWYSDPEDRHSIRKIPVQLPSSMEFSDIARGANHACGLITNGTIHCWGGNGYGQGIAPSSAASVSPISPDSSACMANLVMPLGSSCEASFFGEDYRFAVSEDGLGRLYRVDNGAEELLQSQYGIIEESFFIINGSHTDYTVLKAHANPERGWVIEVFGNQS